MSSFHFTNLANEADNERVEREAGSPGMCHGWATHEWQGATPIDALLRQWATCLPDTRLVGPLRCEEDGHTYHLRLNERGDREITVIAEPIQFHVKTY